VPYHVAKRYGYPLVALTPLEELEDRIEAIEAALADGAAVDPDGAR